MRHVRAHREWSMELLHGKTLGVLLYEGGYLAAFSGTLGGSTMQEGFVPPVFDPMHLGSWFREEGARISAINERIKALGQEAAHSSEEGCRLRHERRVRSQALQQWLYAQYRFLNARGEERSLPELVPPTQCVSGMGDCCAPKLLQEAYRQGITPLAVAEWDAHTGDFCAPCTTRCRPILTHMLEGLDVEDDPRLTPYTQLASTLETVYEDDRLLVVDKPSGMLSVPGRDFLPSVVSVTGCLPVHRLDQDTSGLMILAKNPAEQSRLHHLFESREVTKRYEALLELEMTVGAEFDIALPLCPDITHRPRQVVSAQFGKKALTHGRVLDNVGGHALVQLSPHTGRTHQLRVHCAHPDGLGNPIVGDRLYGTPGARLMLHAAELWLPAMHFISPHALVP